MLKVNRASVLVCVLIINEQLALSFAVRQRYRDVEPEDFVLDELASIYHHPLKDVGLSAMEAEGVPKQLHGRPIPFAFKPSDPRYYGREAPPSFDYNYGRAPLLRQRVSVETSNNAAGSTADRLPINIRGQKENVNYVGNEVDNQPQFVNLLPTSVHETPKVDPPTTLAAKSEADTDGKGAVESQSAESLVLEDTKDQSRDARINYYKKNVPDGPNAGGPIAEARQQPLHSQYRDNSLSDIYFTALVAGCTAVAVAGVIGIGVCLYRLQKGAKAAAEVEYPAYGVTGPGPSPELTRPSVSNMTSPKGHPGSTAVAKVVGDRKLAQSAHMFHYQHQKQQVIAMERHAQSGRHGSASGGESEEETEEGDYTVYECPGLAPTGEMEVKNPLFLDDPTPASPANFRHHDH